MRLKQMSFSSISKSKKQLRKRLSNALSLFATLVEGAGQDTGFNSTYFAICTAMKIQALLVAIEAGEEKLVEDIFETYFPDPSKDELETFS